MDNSAEKTPGRRYLFSRRLGRVFIYAILSLGAFISIVPFVWMMSASLMTRNEALSSQLITKQPLIERFTYSEGELDKLLSEGIPDFVKETDALGVHELKMTARECRPIRDLLGCWRLSLSWRVDQLHLRLE